MSGEARDRLLVVDDEKDIADALATYGRAKGYEVTVARDGLTALAIAEKERPDVVLLDISLPGMDGRDVMTRLQRAGLDRELLVIFLTARDSQSDRIAGLELGAVEYETKPLHFDSLFQKIRHMVRKRRQGEL